MHCKIPAFGPPSLASSARAAVAALLTSASSSQALPSDPWPVGFLLAKTSLSLISRNRLLYESFSFVQADACTDHLFTFYSAVDALTVINQSVCAPWVAWRRRRWTSSCSAQSSAPAAAVRSSIKNFLTPFFSMYRTVTRRTDRIITRCTRA